MRDLKLFTAFAVSFAAGVPLLAQTAPVPPPVPPAQDSRVQPAPTSQTATGTQSLTPAETLPTNAAPPIPTAPSSQTAPSSPEMLTPQITPTATGPSAPAQLPAPTGRPFQIDFAADPVLRLRRGHATWEQFRAAVAAAVEQHPGVAEAAATEDEALGVVREARSAMRPTVDLNVTGYRVLSREFSNDPTNIIERSRPEQRTDAVLTAQQVVFDFGATARRAAAAGARLRAAGADLEANADSIALNAVGAWYDVFGYRAIVALSEAFLDSQRELRGAIETRIRQGVSAEGDLASIDAQIARSLTRLARFRRLLATAEARFAELTGGVPAPVGLVRAPAPGLPAQDREDATLAAQEAPAVRSARAIADATHDEARAARADQLPSVSAGIEAGRYGVFENERDYDIRSRVGVRWRLFGNTDARLDQAQARARTADARATRIGEEAARDAAIAWTDLQALEQQMAAAETAYIASRRSRDVIVERFRQARGTIFDVVQAEDSYFESAASYIQTLTELDAARYILLSRTGRLLEALEIDTDRLRGEGER